MHDTRRAADGFCVSFAIDGPDVSSRSEVPGRPFLINQEENTSQAMRANSSGQSALLLLDIIDILCARRVSYAIIGAAAASFYGVVRTSMDADALIALPPGQANVQALSDALRKAGLKSAYRWGDADDPIGAVVNVEDRFGNRVDLLMRIRGMTEAVFSRTVEAEFMNVSIRMIGLEDFIAMKIFAGSPKDLNDAAGALQVSSHRVNPTLLKVLVQPYGKDALRTLESLRQAHRPKRPT